jgi:hypothetical protein
MKTIAAIFALSLTFKAVQYFRWYMEVKVFQYDWYTNYIIWLAGLNLDSELINQALLGIPYLCIEIVVPSAIIAGIWVWKSRSMRSAIVAGGIIAVLQYPINIFLATPTILRLNIYLWGIVITPISFAISVNLVKHVTNKASRTPQAAPLL